MYFAQVVEPIAPTIKALNDAGISGFLLVGVIAMLLGGGLMWMVLRNRGKQLDSGSAKATSDAQVMTALTGIVAQLATNITKLTDNQLEMQTGARKRDQQIDLTIKATDEQNRLLTAGNQLAQRMLAAVQDNTKDTHDVLDATVDHLDAKADKSEANILARIDTQTQRVINSAAESHSNLKQTIIERTKSIEDLFTRITNENEDLNGKLELREATIISLQTRLTEAEQERDALKAKVIPQPEPPDPPPPDHKAAIPGDFEPVAKLPKASGE